MQQGTCSKRILAKTFSATRELGKQLMMEMTRQRDGAGMSLVWLLSNYDSHGLGGKMVICAVLSFQVRLW